VGREKIKKSSSVPLDSERALLLVRPDKKQFPLQNGLFSQQYIQQETVERTGTELFNILKRYVHSANIASE